MDSALEDVTGRGRTVVLLGVLGPQGNATNNFKTHCKN